MTTSESGCGCMAFSWSELRESISFDQSF
jgi:hypothetical protein